MRTRLTLVTCLVALTALPAAAAPSSVDSLTATAGATTVSVTGTATFTDVAVETGTDPAGDAQTPGTDLTRSSASFSTTNRIKFRLDIGNALPQISSSPAAVTLWPITVDGVADTLNLHASRMRAGTTPDVPHLRLVRIAGGTITTVAQLTGTMANGIVEWEVPMNAIGATGGSVITTEAAITVIPGISGVGTVNGSNFDDMFVEGAYTVPSRSVSIGIGDAGAPADSISLTGTATVAANGSFTGSLPKPAPGTYQVVAKGCFGPQSCGLRSTTITI